MSSSMKKIRIFLIALLSFVLLLTMASCGGGAEGTVDGFMKALKKLDVEKALSYCYSPEQIEELNWDINIGDMVAERLASDIDATQKDLQAFGEDIAKDVFSGLKYTVQEENIPALGESEGKKYVSIICENIDASATFQIFFRSIVLESEGFKYEKVPLKIARQRWNREMDFARERELITYTEVFTLTETDGEWRINSPEFFIAEDMLGWISAY